MDAEHFKFITLQQMDALVCLVEERSFSEAARRMMLTQPSLSKHIRNLEDLVDCRLINRNRTGISLTPEGSILYGYAKRMLRLRDEAREKIQLARESVSGLIFAGASTIPATYLLPPVVTGLRKSHPDIKVHVTTGDTDNIIHMVLAGQVEIGFIGNPVNDRRLVSETIWDDELVLVSNADHPWAASGEADLSELEREPFVVREKGSGTRSVFEEYLKDRFNGDLGHFHTVGEMGSTEAVKEAVIAGLGVSVLSIHAVRREIEMGILVRIRVRGMSIQRPFFIIRKKQLSLLPHQQLFVETAKAYRPKPV
ncbi:MAG TPA: selenium metabolism-associated LysR family transcriptional regulator [Deltaproteobacteria bacterium]|nr:selenium metabolism-associated LysR family transcriptional regulator [Deltaproteobacteria bacterium]HPR54406.1 selenium metabolism-associated LysR family transcriptional regulator [Deltaproteobacteria bacterium]HXK46265.1 selenium metabolism-associated LysR family transcriptional regulator [Deltaproteobacteria bacterium]